MKRRILVFRVVAAIACCAGLDGPGFAADPSPSELAERAVRAVGGKEKLLRLFRYKELYTLGSNPNKTPRTSIVEPPKHWWLGTKDRMQAASPEPATWLVWAWTLGPLVDPDSKLTSAAAVDEGDRKLVGLEVAGSIDPAMKLYFDPETSLLVRIDWRNTQYVFSDWKEADGAKYPARCVAHRTSGAEFVGTEIIELERLSELPADLKRE